MSRVGPVVILDLAADLCEQHKHLSAGECVVLYSACLAATIAGYAPEARGQVRRIVDQALTGYIAEIVQP
jgi:hypothetical protein